MELTAEQAAKAKVLFEYEEAKKALAQRRGDIQAWGKALIAAGEALLNHPGTIVLDEAANAVACGKGQARGHACNLVSFSGNVQISDVAPGLSPAGAALKGGAALILGHYPFALLLARLKTIFYN